MAKTCHYCDCESSYGEVKLRRCAGCQKVYYCSTTCQKNAWIFHIFDCNPLQPINTAYYLARAVRRDLLPDHPQTCEDYGFDRAVTTEEKTMLFGLYVGLMSRLEIPPKTIHNWRVRGVLVDEIKAAFYKMHSRGAYFRWFLANEHIVALAGQPLSDDMLHDHGDANLMRAWRFAGGSDGDSIGTIRAAIASKPFEEQQCYTLYTLLLAMCRPAPDLDLWIDFGFAARTSERGEKKLSATYQRLIRRCSFKEFCDAYRGGRLLDLFRSKRLEVDDPHGHLQDLLHGPAGSKKSVWYLKWTIVQEEATEESESSMERSVMVDYGFVNCKNDSERRQLKRVYRAFFDSDGDPLALHKAAIKGDLYGYLSTVVKDLKDPKFKRLMNNPYPLPDL